MIPMGFRLVGAALELYSAEGAEGVSLRKLGTKLGVSPSALYGHFRSRAHLLDAVANGAFVSMETYLDRHRNVAPARARLGAITADALDFALGHPRLFKLMFDEARRPGWAHETLVRHAERLIKQAAREEPDQVMDPLRPTELARAWLALIVGAAALHRCGLYDEPALRELSARAAGRILGFAYA